jgi:uncharacterized membrane protein YccF (DUF307 family)
LLGKITITDDPRNFEQTGVTLAITIIGIPFAWTHLKLAKLDLRPIGKIIIPTVFANLPVAPPRQSPR